MVVNLKLEIIDKQSIVHKHLSIQIQLQMTARLKIKAHRVGVEKELALTV